MNEPQRPDMLTEEETVAFIETAMRTSGTLMEEQIKDLIMWAENVRFEAMIVDMVIRGDVGIAPSEDSVNNPVFVAEGHTFAPLKGPLK